MPRDHASRRCRRAEDPTCTDTGRRRGRLARGRRATGCAGARSGCCPGLRAAARRSGAEIRIRAAAPSVRGCRGGAASARGPGDPPRRRCARARPAAATSPGGRRGSSCSRSPGRRRRGPAPTAAHRLGSPAAPTRRTSGLAGPAPTAPRPSRSPPRNTRDATLSAVPTGQIARSFAAPLPLSLSSCTGSQRPPPPDGLSELVVVAPPSTDTTSPVMYEASSESRNATTAPISSGLPARRSGVVVARCAISLPPPVAPPAPANSSVGTIPGATTLTRTPSGPPYTAADRARPSTACLEVW